MSLFVPQADLLSFQPTLLLLPVSFLVGYYFFVTRWVPRVLLTLRARHWVTQVRAVGAAGLATPEVWPEIFLVFVQFAGLVYFLSRLTLVVHPDEGLTPLRYTPPAEQTFARAGGAAVENFFFLWGHHRRSFFFAPAAAGLSTAVDRALAGFSFFTPGKVFPLLGVVLKKKLARAGRSLSETPPVGPR